MATELELKLALRPERLAALRKHPALTRHAVAPGKTRWLDNTYFDTPELDLHKARVGLRIRVQDGRHIQTLKTSGSAVGGLHNRQEWNVELPDDRLDLALFPAEALPEALRDPALVARIGPVFTTRFEREAIHVRLPAGGEAELALDKGEILAGGASTPICEVELELLDGGSGGALFGFARELAGIVPMHVAHASKAERGYALGRGERAGVQALPRVALTPELSVSEGFARIASAALDHWQYHQLLFLSLASDAPEAEDAVAALAEAAEWLRLSLSLFSGPMTRRATVALREALAELDQALAWLPTHVAARELEGRLAAGSGVYRQLTGRKTLRALVGQERGAWAGRSAALRERLDSSVHAQAQLYLGAWLIERGWEQDAAPKVRAQLQAPLRDFAHDRLNRLWRELHQACHGDRPKRRSDYADQALHLAKLRVYTRVLGELFEREAIADFVPPWLDLESGVRELAQQDYLRRLSAEFQGEVRSGLDEWLAQQEASLLTALELTRRAALKRRPYWLD